MMKSRRSGLIFLLLIVLTSTQAQQVSMTQVVDFGENPGQLQMLWYLPKKTQKPMPLVVVLHGCTQTGEDVTTHSGWNKLADSLGFAIIYPQTGPYNNVSRCFNWFKPEDVSGRRGESASIKNMIDFLLTKEEIDEKRIFITGLSAGGAMAVAMMAQYPETFAAGAVFTGGAYGLATGAVEASRAMRAKVNKTPDEWGNLVRAQNPGYSEQFPRISIFQGLKDKTVNPVNAQHLVAQWTNLHRAQLLSPIADNTCAGHKFVQCSSYANVKGETVVRLYLFDNLGHAVSIDPGLEINKGGKVGKYFRDTGFHSTWQCAVDFGLTEKR
jgi:poly(hydroxyalkanoate) depolymerase family esterase